MNIIKKATVLLLTLCAIFTLTAIPAAALDETQIDPILILSAETNLTVFVDGKISASLSGKYPYGETASISAPAVAEKTFRYWTNGDGEVISYAQSLPLTMYAPTTVNAVYGDSAETPVNLAAFTAISRYGNSIAFCGTGYAASGGVTDSGVLYSTTASTLSALQTLSPDEAIETSGNCWTLLVTPEDESTTYYAVAYAVAGGETCYSPVKTVKFSELESSVSLVANLGEITLQSISADEYFCNVSFDPNGGVGAMAPQGMVKDVATALNANTFSHPDKPFNYWNTKADGTGTSYADEASVTLTGDVTLYAQWKEPATVSAAPTANTLTYDGAAHALVTAGTTTEGAIQYALGNDATAAPTGEYSATIPTGTNAGTYYVWYNVVGDDSHTDSDPACVTVTINKAAITPTVTMSGWTYGGTASAPGVTSGNSGNGTVTCSYKLKTAGDEAYDSAPPTAAGTYKVRAVIAETDNYSGKTVETEFTIAQAALTVTASSGSVTYGDAPKGFGVTYSGFVNSDTESVLSGAVSYSFDYAQYGNAGTYKITPSGLSAANYAITYADGALTVNPKTVGLTWSETSFVYDGTSKLPTATATGLVNNDTCAVTVTGAQTDVGENYTATASALSNSNYALPAEKTASFKITPGTQDGVSATDYTGTYDGAAHSITVTVSNGGTVTYSETDAGTYSATNPAYTNAGTYTVYYKVTRTGYNDAVGSAKVTITQKAVGLSWGDTAFSYDGTEKLPTATATGLIDGDTCTVTVAGAQTNVGENYTATASALSNSNYALPAENTTSFKITPGTQDGITATDYAGTYDGAAHGITVTASNGGTVTYSAPRSGAYSATNPTYTDAGTYAVYYKVEKAGYNDATGSANVKINKKSVTVSGLTAATKTYDGTVTAELVASGAAYDGLLSGDSLSVAGTAAFADADAGDSKTVNITGLSLSGTSAENYALSADTATGTGKITKRPITITAANQTVGLAGNISEGADKISVSSGSLVDGHSISAITLTASDTANVTTSGTITPSAATIKSGAADVTANYEIAYANGVLTVSEGAPAVTAPTANALTYNGEAQTLTTTGSVTGGTMEYTLGSDASAAPVNGYAATIPTGTNTGTYYVWYRVTGDSNHSDVAAACITVTIGKGTPTVVAPTANTLTYDGTAKALVAAGSATGGALEYASGADGTATPASGWGTAIPTGTDAGTYYVWYRVTGGDNYNDIAASSVAATIGKKTVTVTANQQTVALNGAIDTAVSNAVLSGAADGHTLSVVTLTGSDTANATTSGTITPSAAKIVSGETDVTENYEITYVNGVLTVSQGESGVIAPTAKNLTYSGEAQELVTVGAATGGAMQYALGTDASAAPASGYDTAIPTGTDAGTYYVWYKVVGDADHTDTAPACVTAVIGKAAITPTVAITGWTRGGTANAPSVSGNPGNGTVTYAYKLKTAEDEAYDSNVPVDAGTYKVRAVISETGNYLGKTVEAEFTITESDSPALTAPTAKELTYSGVAQELVTAGTATGGAMRYALGADASAAPTENYDTAIPTGTNAGTYYVWYKVTGDGSHSDTAPACVTVTVSKATITPSVSINGWTYGETANAPVVTGNSGNGAVTYSYKLKTAEDEAYDSAVPTAAGTYKVRAVIEETDNYSGKTVEAEFTIAQAVLTVTASSGSVTYGDAPKGFGVTYSGFVNSDTESVLSGAVSYSFDYAQYGNAGNYKITPSGLSAANYAITYADGKLTVNPKTVGLTWGDTAFSYDGTEKLPTATATGLVDGDACTVTVTGGQTDVGENYTATASELSNANYVLPAENTVSFKITSGTQDGVTAQGWSGTYDGAAHGITVNAPSGATITYSESESGVYSATAPAYTNAGTYTVFYKVARTGYNDVTDSQTVEISPKTVGLTWGDTAFSYDGTEKLPTATATGLVDGDACTVTVTGGQTDVGENYTATASELSNANYVLPAENTVSFKITSGTQDGVTAQGWKGTYDGAAHGITVNAPSGATVTYSESESGTYATTNPTYTDAGTYTVFYKVTLAGYDDVSGSQTVNISRKEIVVSGITAANKPYDGNVDATLIYDNVTFNGIISGDELTVTSTGTFADAETGNGKTVSITNLSLGGADAGNYQLAKDGQQTATTASITTTLTYTVIWLNGDGTELDRKTYAEGQQEPTTDKTPVKESDAENVYTFSKWTLDKTEGNVKTYKPEFTATAKTVYTVIWLNGDGTQLDSKTYAEGQQEPTTDKTPVKESDAENVYTFSKWTLDKTEGNVKTYKPEFTATAKTVYTVIWLNGDGTELDRKTYAEGQQEPTTDKVPVKESDAANTYTFSKWMLDKTEGNIKIYAPEFTATPIGKEPEKTLSVTAEGWTGMYDGEAHSITVTAPAGATVTYSESESGTYSAENPAYKDAGNYTVYYRVEKSGYDTVSGSATIAISKATLIPTLTFVDRSNPDATRCVW